MISQRKQTFLNVVNAVLMAALHCHSHWLLNTRLYQASKQMLIFTDEVKWLIDCTSLSYASENYQLVSRSVYLKCNHVWTCMMSNLTGLQSEHLPAAALEWSQAQVTAGLQVRFAHRWSQDVQMSLEARPVLRQWEECKLSWCDPREHPPLHLP